MDNLFSVAERFGTPCFVFDEVQLTRRMKAVRAIVPEDIRLCYSIKANPFLIPAMRRLVGTLEVCSPGELEICRQQGVSPDMVLFSGVNKTKADVERAMDLGVTRFTCESPLHVRLIDEAARSRGRVYPVLLRLTAGSQFGMDERDFFAALDHRAATPGIRIEGVHYFSGTQRKKLDGQRKELAMLCALADRLKAEYGMETVRVEYGPGLYFPYFNHEDHSDTLAPIRELAPDLAALAAHCELTIEMGRFFASECGAYLTRVVDTKVNGGTAYAMLPDNEEFLARFAEQYQKLLAEVCARAPEIDLVEKNARQRANYPAPYAPNPSAPTRGALAPLELAAERVGVPEDVPYTPKLLAATFMGSFDKDPADRFPALLDGRDSTLVTERAIAAAVPEEFVTALVSKTLGELPIL